MQNFPYLFSTLWTIVTLILCNVMCGSNLLSCIPPSGLFHFFHSAKYICMWKVKIPWGVCRTFYFTVELSQRLKNLFKNSTMVPDASNLVWSNLWVKFNVVHTLFLIFFTLCNNVYFAEWKKWNNPEGGTYDSKFEPHIMWVPLWYL